MGWSNARKFHMFYVQKLFVDNVSQTIVLPLDFDFDRSFSVWINFEIQRNRIGLRADQALYVFSMKRIFHAPKRPGILAIQNERRELLIGGCIRPELSEKSGLS